MGNTYAKLTEHNEHEGETWHFWIPIEGNEDALDQLEDTLTGMDENEPHYELNLAPVPEAEVDLLIKHADKEGYMPAHTKLSGKLTMTEQILEGIRETGEPLYKGGIRDLCTS